MKQAQKYRHGRRTFTFQRTAVAATVAACFSAPALANPVNPTVVHGTASFAQAGNILNITNSHNAIINWGSFSIGVNELTRFIQPSALSAVLNRVTGQDPSAILGALQSNGRVFLLNPNGIVFGAGSQINVAGLVASTLNLSNDDFLNNRMRFTDGAGAGSVVNNGSITGGSVYLVGNAVTNNGLISSPGGEVVLAAGNSVELVNPGTPNLRVEVVAPDNEARNLGTISAEAGRIGIYAGLINNSGTLNASSAVVEGGRILLKATKNVHLAAASQTSASGVSGGRIDIEAGDTAMVEGDIAATGSAGAGGTVQVLGNLVGLTGHANVDASGSTQGGTVLVGGDFQGGNPEVQNAFRTYVGSDVTINADAVTAGDGGRVIVWADDVTRFYGNISARGGANGGDGGFAEVSGKRVLDFQGAANLSATGGTFGTLLLDPDFIVVATTGANTVDTTTLFADGPGGTSTIAPATLNASSAAIVLQANEDIDVNESIFLTNPGVSITMQAGGFLNVNSSITTRGGAITLVAGDAGSLTSPSEGALNINAALDATGAGANPLGANITLSAPISDVGGNSVVINANITAGAAGAGGGVTITGQRLDHNSGTITGSAVNVTTTSAGSGDITLAGGNIQSQSVYLEAERNVKMTGSSIVAVSGSVSLHADSDGNDDGAIALNNSVINANSVSMTGGNGYAAGNSSNPAGISITNNSQVVANGSVDLRGLGSANSGGYGVLIDTSFVHNSSGSTYVEGTGGAGPGKHGVKLVSASLQNTGASGTMEVFGYGTGSGADGVNIGASSGISTLGSGSVRITGSGGAGAKGINMQGATAFIGGTNATEVFLNSLSGGMTLDGSVTACQSCGSLTLKSTAGAAAGTAALTASGLRVLGTGSFNLDNNSNSLETVAAFLSGGPNLLHVHDQNNMQVGSVTSWDGVASTLTTGVNVGTGAGNVVDLHIAGALLDGGGTVTAGGQILLDAASIGATGAGAIGVNRGAGGTVSLTSASGGIFVEQVTGAGAMLLGNYTISPATGQTVELTSSGGTLTVGGSMSLAGNDLYLLTTGANDIQFNAGAPGTIAANSLILGPAAGGSVLFNGGVSPWTINAPVTVQNNAAVDVSGGQTVNFNNTFNATGAISVGSGGTLNFNAGTVMLSGALNLSGSLGGTANVSTGGVFNWSGGTVGGSGQLITSSTATTNITGSVALAPGKTWSNDGTVNLGGASTLDLGDSTPAIFNNQAGGVVNIASSAGWSFTSDSSSQAGQINNAGTINVNTTYTAWEAAFNNAASGVLNVGAGNTLSLQNGQNIAGTVNIGSGGTLAVSEYHGVNTVFSNTVIGGNGTVHVAGSGPKAKFTNVSAPGATLRLGGGGQIEILNGTATFAALTLDSPSYGGAFSISNGVFAQSAGNLIVPGGANYSGSAKYWAQGGDAIISGVVNAAYGGANMEIKAAGNVKVLGGGDVSGVVVKLQGVNVEIGESTATSPASVYASSMLDILADTLKIHGGSGANASALVSSNGALTVSASGDVILAGGAGTNAWAKISGNPDTVLASVGGAVYMDAGSGSGSYAAIESVSPNSIYVTFPNLAGGGYFVNGVEGVVYDAATGTGFIAGGSPAVLAGNLIVTYGGSGGGLSGDSLGVPTQTLIVATGKSTEPPDAEKDKDVFKESEDDKKKDAPVCK